MSSIPDGSLVSIVLPVYNGERYLAESMQSCLNQTYQHWELIVVDDASTDATPEIVAAFASRDGRIRSVCHEKNTRLPGALNSGFARARGELLTWTSDDNRYHPDALAEMVSLLVTRPDVDYVYSDYDVIDADGHFVQTNEVASPLHLMQMYDGVACFLYRRCVYDRVGEYANDLFLAEDYDFFLRVLASGCVMHPLHKSLYDYRIHSHSLSDEQRGRTFAAAECALRRHLPEFRGAGAEVRGGLFLYLASLAAWRKDYIRACGYTVAALRFVPLRVLAKGGSFLRESLRRLGHIKGGTQDMFVIDHGTD